MNIETLNDLGPSPEGDDRQYIKVLTGIPDLDAMLAPLLKKGGLVIIGSETGHGKTAFASCIAARLVARRKRVRFISPRNDATRIIGRMLSSLVPWPNDKLIDGFSIEHCPGGADLPQDAEEDPAFETAGVIPLIRIQTDLDFHYAPKLLDDPHTVLSDLVFNRPAPHCLIIDDFYFHGAALDGGYTLTSLATELMAYLWEYSTENQIPVLVFCHLKPNRVGNGTKFITPSQISEFPKIADHCDAFLGLSALAGKASFRETGELAKDQYVCVCAKGSPKLIPVSREFSFQRFVPRVDDGLSDDLQERMRKLKAATKIGGSMKVRRSDLSAVAALRHPPSLNVFVFALLVANWQEGESYGKFFYGLDQIADLLGMKQKPVRLALEKLEEAGLLVRGPKNGRAYVRRVANYPKMKGASKDFFFLAYNLRDPSRAGLLGNPELLRTWITAISLAQHSPCPDTDAGRGQFPDDVSDLCRRIAAITGDKVSTVETAVETLMGEGRMSTTSIQDYREFVEIPNYEIYQSGEFYKSSKGNRRATSLPFSRAITPALEGQSEGNTGADEGQSEGN